MLISLIAVALMQLSPFTMHADTDPDPNIGVKLPTPPSPPGPIGEGDLKPGAPPIKDPDPDKKKMPSRDKIHLTYKDYTLSLSFSGEPEAAHIVLRDTETELINTADFDTDTTSVYLPMEPGNYNVVMLTASNKTYRGLLILE